jgi:cation-transporting ATPase 13A2
VAAPITSTLPTPSSVLSVLRHGRCSLITAYALVLFNILYAFIQLNMTMLLYGYGIEVNNYIYIIQDLCFAFSASIVIAEGPAEIDLSEERPPEGFFNKYMVLKLMPQLVLFAFFQVISLQLLFWQPFYGSGDDDLPTTPLSTGYAYEATTVNTLALAQLWLSSAVASIGRPFRRPWHRNQTQVTLMGVQASWVLLQLFLRYNEFTSQVLDIKPVPISFALQLLALLSVQALCSFGLSKYADGFRTEVTLSPRSLRHKDHL